MGTGGSGSNVGNTYGSHDDGFETNSRDNVQLSVGDSLSVGENLNQASLIDESLVKELETKGEKFTRANMKFVTKDQTGQIVWLEAGTAKAGLEHILHGDGKSSGHAKDFERAFNVAERDVPGYLYKVVTLGNVVKNELKPINGKRMGYERVYKYNNRYFVIAGIGTNGYIVSAYPSDKYKE